MSPSRDALSWFADTVRPISRRRSSAELPRQPGVKTQTVTGEFKWVVEYCCGCWVCRFRSFYCWPCAHITELTAVTLFRQHRRVNSAAVRGSLR